MRAAGESLEDMSEVNGDVSRLMARQTAQNAPRRSGRLAASVQPRATATTATVVSGATSGVLYAGVIEGGWRARNIAPSHFTARAVEQVAPAAITAYEDAVDQALDQIKGA
jgi:hypothetical protein